MNADARLNLLLTPSPARAGGGQPWQQTISRLLVPLGVRTFEAKSGPEAVDLMERHPIHLAVVDTRLPTMGGLDVLQLMQRLREQGLRSPSGDWRSQVGAQAEDWQAGVAFQFRMHVEETTEHGHTQRRIEVRFDSRPMPKGPGPVVILIAPPPAQQDPQLLQEALKFNAFSVINEPVDVNLALDVMARALKRFHQNQWPGASC
jgi:CheY-like chemotaxis protein